MLSIRNLRTRHLTVEALDIAAGDCVAIMGPSGSGKSLLLRAIADLDPNSGTVTLDGTDRDTMPAPDWRRRVGYLAAESGWWAETAGEHFSDREAARPVLAALDLAENLLSRPLAHASTGERQRLALARLLSNGPQVLLLDEPTAALDPTTTARVETALAALCRQGTAILLVTHNPDQAARLASQCWHVADGRLCPAPGEPAPEATS